jgi:hypothetical protein
MRLICGMFNHNLDKPKRMQEPGVVCLACPKPGLVCISKDQHLVILGKMILVRDKRNIHIVKENTH